MSKSSTTTTEKSARHAQLIRYIERQIHRNECIIRDCTEELTRDFNENFAWKSEVIYKGNLKLAFLRTTYTTLSSEECDEEYAKFFLRHAVEHAADDVMHRDPYSSSSNAAVNLANRWEFESRRDIYHLAMNLLDRLIITEE